MFFQVLDSQLVEKDEMLYVFPPIQKSKYKYKTHIYIQEYFCCLYYKQMCQISQRSSVQENILLQL